MSRSEAPLPCGLTHREVYSLLSREITPEVRQQKAEGFFSMWIGLGWDGIGLFFLKETISTICGFFCGLFLGLR